jgi:hypothetical protein
MQKYIGTRIKNEEKIKFQAIAKSFKLSESALLRLIISVLIDKPNLLKNILDEVHSDIVKHQPK